MDTLTIDQLKQVPWLGTVDGIVYEPPIQEMPRMVNIPFAKRDSRFPLFYSWCEIIKTISGTNHQILDASCGKGVIPQILTYKGHSVTACDIKDYFMADRTRIDFRLLDLNGPMPYPDNHFNVVINCEGLQYLTDFFCFFKESGRVLKNGGHLIFSINNIHNLDNRLFFLRRGEFPKYSVTDEAGYRQLLSLTNLTKFLKAVSFKIFKVKGNCSCLSHKTLTVNKILGRFLFEKKNNIKKFAHSLIIDAQLKK